MKQMTEDQYVAALTGVGEWEFVRDTYIAGKMYEWWRHKPTNRLHLADSALRDQEFVDRLRTIVDAEAFGRIAGVEEFGEAAGTGEVEAVLRSP